MNWSLYLYLAPAALVALLGLFVMARMVPRLSEPTAHRTPLEVAAVVLLCSYGLFVIYGNFFLERLCWAYPIGDAASDTIEQYVPFYANLVDQVRAGTLSTWNFEYELGCSIMTYQSWLFDPFNVVVVGLTLLLGNAHLSLALVASQAAKVLLSALLFDHLLTRYCTTPLARILGSLLYAFTGMIILYGQHYFMGGALPLFTATVLAFELYLEQPQPRNLLLVTLVVALQLIWSVYIAFMSLLAAAFYLLLRIPHVRAEQGVGAWLRAVGLAFVPVICGALLSGILLVPYAHFLMRETSRVAAEAPLGERVAESLTSFIYPDWIPLLLSRALGSSLILTGTGDYASVAPTAWTTGVGGPYEFILLGYSGGAFVLLGQYYHWLFTQARVRDRILATLGTLLVALYCCNFFLPSLFTIMVRLQYRSSFVLALPVCIAMALGFEKRLVEGEPNRPLAVLCGVVTMGVLAWSLVYTQNGRLVCVSFVAATVVALAMLAVLGGDSRWRNLATATFVAALFAMQVSDGFFCTNSRSIVEPEHFPHAVAANDNGDTAQALAYLRQHDQSFYRIEKTYPVWSPLNDSLVFHYAGASAYNSSADGDVERFYQQLWQEAVSTWAAYSQGYKNDRNRPDVLSLLGIKYVLTMDTFDYDWCVLEKRIGGVNIYRNTQDPSLVTVREQVVSESEADALADAQTRRALLENAVIVPDETAATWSNATGKTTVAKVGDLTCNARGVLSTTIAADANSVVCLAVPHTGTWRVTVDGKPVKTFVANYGFYGFTLAPGTHAIEASYHLAGLVPGAIMSIAGVALTAGAYLVLRRQRQREDGIIDLPMGNVA